MTARKPKTAAQATKRRPRTSYRYPTMADTLASNGLPSIPTGLGHYDAVLKQLLNARVRRGR